MKQKYLFRMKLQWMDVQLYTRPVLANRSEAISGDYNAHVIHCTRRTKPVVRLMG